MHGTMQQLLLGYFLLSIPPFSRADEHLSSANMPDTLLCAVENKVVILPCDGTTGKHIALHENGHHWLAFEAERGLLYLSQMKTEAQQLDEPGKVIKIRLNDADNTADFYTVVDPTDIEDGRGFCKGLTVVGDYLYVGVNRGGEFGGAIYRKDLHTGKLRLFYEETENRDIAGLAASSDYLCYTSRTPSTNKVVVLRRSDASFHGVCKGDYLGGGIAIDPRSNFVYWVSKNGLHFAQIHDDGCGPVTTIHNRRLLRSLYSGKQRAQLFVDEKVPVEKTGLALDLCGGNIIWVAPEPASATTQSSTIYWHPISQLGDLLAGRSQPHSKVVDKRIHGISIQPRVFLPQPNGEDQASTTSGK